MNAATALAAQADETLVAMLAAQPSVLRDSEGNLRGLTDEEEAFGKALRAEAVRRGLL